MMTLRFLLIILVVNARIAFGQDCKECPPLSTMIEKESTPATNPAMDLSQGVLLENGKITLSPEATRLLMDSAYRQSIYPAFYSFDSIPVLLNRKEYHRVLWHLVNAYSNNQQLAYNIALQLAQKGIKGDFYVSAFYTYALFDPETMSIENGKPVLINPEKIEAKMKLFRQFSMIP